MAVAIEIMQVIFPLLYGLAFAFAYAWLSGRRASTALDFVLFFTPLVAARFDYAENTVHLGLLSGIETRSDVERAISEGRFSDSVVFLASAFRACEVRVVGRQRRRPADRCGRSRQARDGVTVMAASGIAPTEQEPDGQRHRRT